MKQPAVAWPSTGRSMPVTWRLASLGKTTASTMLSTNRAGDPPIVVVGEGLFEEPHHLAHPRLEHLAAAAGQTVFTRMPSRPVSSAAALANPGARTSRRSSRQAVHGPRESMEPMLTTEPPPGLSSGRRLADREGPESVHFEHATKIGFRRIRRGPWCKTPALFTRMSMPPRWAVVADDSGPAALVGHVEMEKGRVRAEARRGLSPRSSRTSASST